MALDDLDEEEMDGEDGEIEDIITDIEDECSLIFSNPDNAKLLNEIFDMARAHYEKDKKGWTNFFANLKMELISTDDEDNIRDILAHHLRKAKLELI
ncbi:MAG TPA: hypothetical protein VF974_06500 [Patescibacteria group bacterium]